MNWLSAIYQSARLYGADNILRAYIGLPGQDPLPITIPHGVDFYHLRRDLDIDCHEPVYLAWREDIAQRVKNVKLVLRFPHPWLFLLDGFAATRGKGTLFIAPPPSIEGFIRMYERILGGSYPTPWGVLIKQRGVRPEDFDWWRAKGFSVHTAGSIEDPAFYYNLRDIIEVYEVVASPNMSSAVIFGVAMERLARAIPDVGLSGIDIPDIGDVIDLEDREGLVSSTWHDLLSEDRAVALHCARTLLGARYMDTRDALRSRYFAALAQVKCPLHLSPITDGFAYRILATLIKAGVPLHKFFPHPFRKTLTKLLGYLRLNRLSITVGSDFAHYGICGNSGRLAIQNVFAFQLGHSVSPGQAVRGKNKD